MALPNPKSPSKATELGGTGSTLPIWPLVIAIEDCFVPQSAQLVIETISEQSNETCAIIWALAGTRASGEWGVN